jgi:phage gp29-like protein
VDEPLNRTELRRNRRQAEARRRATSANPGVMPDATVLGKHYFQAAIPQQENYRTHFGKSLDLQKIDYAIRSANNGLMRPMTDLARETVSLDGHLCAILQKRLNRLAALDHDVQPAAGPNVDPGKAEAYATFVRAQLENIPRFRDAITDLAWGVFDGRAASELDWRAQGGEWHVLGLNWIHARRLSFGPNRDLRVVDSGRETSGFPDIGFPLERVPYKFVIYRPRIFGDYQEREGLAPRMLYWSFFQRFGTRERMALLELFGRPWRIVKPIPGENVNIEAMNTAFDAIKNLGSHNTARLPPGMDVDIHAPFTGAGQVSDAAIDHATKVLSKLVLGSTGTTDAVSTGLGSSVGDAHLSEEDLVIWSDARRLGEAIEDQLTDAIIAVNFGPDQLDHAPRFLFRTEAPLDREGEAKRIGSAIDLGLDVALDEAREKLGIRELKTGEPYLRRVQRPAAFGMLPLPPAPEVVYPHGEAPEPGEIAEQPEVVMNLPDGGRALPPALPPGSILDEPDLDLPALPAPALATADDPDLDGVDDIAALAAKMTELGIERCQHGKLNRCQLCGVERKRDVEVVNGEAVWVVAWKPIPPARMRDGTAAWLVLLRSVHPFDDEQGAAFEQAPVEELRRMVAAFAKPAA